ncbi:hypothetical protein N5K27_26450 [Pigmentiphaga sp. GD03639]|uniref:hypothetical protein n=1 Tax=Pigmentiphaga sp. GD03639 TaxID=2975354 RepID=UPI00244785F2|nr:hypothetical protein [Pigmentiphaga sp. GD03639]MDH2239843.1 hypothetical protein [Pigmentiphaga sp. GD03639]
MKRFFKLTYFLLLITIVSKIAGLIREIALLEHVGISSSLDTFVVIYGICSLLASAVGICVVTNLTPLSRKIEQSEFSTYAMLDGIKTGFIFTTVAWVISFVYVIAVPDEAKSGEQLAIAAIVPATVFFSIIAEYQVAIFLSRNQQTPVISGNIIITLPLIASLLLFNLDITSYAVGLVISFALRTIIFARIAVPIWPNKDIVRLAKSRRSIFSTDLRNTLAGGAAMLSMNLCLLAAVLAANQLDEGEASLVSYGLKIPLLVLTSVWFVFGSRFFSQIISAEGRGAVQKIAKLSRNNAALAISIAALLLFNKGFPEFSSKILNGQKFEILKVLPYSIPLLPVVVFIPIIEMTQRTFATIGQQRKIEAIAFSILIATTGGLAISLYFRSALLILATISVSAVVGALTSLVALRKYSYTKQI